MSAALHEVDPGPEEVVDQAERQLLGAVLTSPTALADTQETLGPHQLRHPRHELILAAAHTLADAGHAVDTLTVADHLQATGNLTRAGGTTYLHALAAGLTTAANASWWAGIIRDAHILRTIATTGRELAALEYTPITPEAALGALDAARGRLDDLVTDPTSAPADHASHVQAAIDSLSEAPGTPTPWPTLTHAIAGWKPGELVIIGARPSIGKTAVAGQILLDAAHRGHHPVMFSLEMPRTQLHLRLMSNIGSVDGGKIQRRQLTPTDWADLEEAGTHLAGLPITIDDRPALSLAQIRAAVRALKRTHDDVGPVVVDYLGLLTPPAGAPRQDRRVQVDHIARGLKNLAKELDVPVIALAQINRGPEARVDKKPQMSDLRESGEIENAADTVILLHRDLTGESDPSDLHVAVPKNRHLGPTQLHLTFVGHYSRVVEPPRWGQAPVETHYTERD